MCSCASWMPSCAFPTFFLILSAVALVGPSLLNVIVVIGLVSWTGTARLVRAEFLTLRESQYVTAARNLGQRSHARSFSVTFMPNAAAPIFVTAVLGIPEAILTEASLSYLGFRRAATHGDVGKHHRRWQELHPRRLVAHSLPRHRDLHRRARRSSSRAMPCAAPPDPKRKRADLLS